VLIARLRGEEKGRWRGEPHSESLPCRRFAGRKTLEGRKSKTKVFIKEKALHGSIRRRKREKSNFLSASRPAENKGDYRVAIETHSLFGRRDEPEGEGGGMSSFPYIQTKKRGYSRSEEPRR